LIAKENFEEVNLSEEDSLNKARIFQIQRLDFKLGYFKRRIKYQQNVICSKIIS